MIEKIKNINDAFHSYRYHHRNIIDARFREKGLYFGQPPILKYLSEHKNATQKDIADFLHVSTPSVAKSLKRMEESGLLVRIENKKDARRNSIKLTRKGKELVEYARQSGKPLLEYNNPDEAECFDNYNSFYENL